MEFNLEELSTLSDTWWPVVLEYGGKLALALVKGKQAHDKRETIRRREVDRETRAAVKARSRG